MEIKIAGGNSFSHLIMMLDPNESVQTESGAMAVMDTGLELRTRFNGGFLGALVMKFFGKESLFVNRFVNRSQAKQRLFLTQPHPGQIVQETLQQSTLFLQGGAYIASSPGIELKIKFAGISSWISGEGLFRMRASGSGIIWYGAYGAVVEKDISGEYIVDKGHLLSYPPQFRLKIQLSGGLFSSFLSGEGFVLKVIGTGKIKLQTRSLGGLASWLNPRFGA
jgi:uncharacterized protein (TIGR00266 family)